MGSFVQKLLPFFLPSPCCCCGRFLEEGEQALCSDCVSKIRWIQPPFCPVCGMPFVSEESGTHDCGSCLKKERPFRLARALGVYEGPLQKAIHQWKYDGKMGITPLFGRWMAAGFENYWAPEAVDLLVPVPIHLHRLRTRGYNQTVLLVRSLSHHTGIPWEARLLRKTRATVPQVHLSGLERERAVRGTFRVARPRMLKGKSVLLVDDVYTTGATIGECAKTLLSAGARKVDVFTLAHAVHSPSSGV